MTRAEAADELVMAGYPHTAAAVEHGVPPAAILRALRSAGDGDGEAARIVAALAE